MGCRGDIFCILSLVITVVTSCSVLVIAFIQLYFEKTHRVGKIPRFSHRVLPVGAFVLLGSSAPFTDEGNEVQLFGDLMMQTCAALVVYSLGMFCVYLLLAVQSATQAPKSHSFRHFFILNSVILVVAGWICTILRYLVNLNWLLAIYLIYYFLAMTFVMVILWVNKIRLWRLYKLTSTIPGSSEKMPSNISRLAYQKKVATRFASTLFWTTGFAIFGNAATLAQIINLFTNLNGSPSRSSPVLPFVFLFCMCGALLFMAWYSWVPLNGRKEKESSDHQSHHLSQSSDLNRSLRSVNMINLQTSPRSLRPSEGGDEPVSTTAPSTPQTLSTIGGGAQTPSTSPSTPNRTPRETPRNSISITNSALVSVRSLALMKRGDSERSKGGGKKVGLNTSRPGTPQLTSTTISTIQKTPPSKSLGNPGGDLDSTEQRGLRENKEQLARLRLPDTSTSSVSVSKALQNADEVEGGWSIDPRPFSERNQAHNRGGSVLSFIRNPLSGLFEDPRGSLEDDTTSSPASSPTIVFRTLDSDTSSHGLLESSHTSPEEQKRTLILIEPSQREAVTPPERSIERVEEKKEKLGGLLQSLNPEKLIDFLTLAPTRKKSSPTNTEIIIVEKKEEKEKEKEKDEKEKEQEKERDKIIISISDSDLAGYVHTELLETKELLSNFPSTTSSPPLPPLTNSPTRTPLSTPRGSESIKERGKHSPRTSLDTPKTRGIPTRTDSDSPKLRGRPSPLRPSTSATTLSSISPKAEESLSKIPALSTVSTVSTSTSTSRSSWAMSTPQRSSNNPTIPSPKIIRRLSCPSPSYPSKLNSPPSPTSTKSISQEEQ